MASLRFEPNPKHGGRKRGRVSAQPTDGQAALDNSIQISETSSRRIGVDKSNEEIVIFMQHLPDFFHGFVVEWKDLEPKAQRLLRDLGLVTSRGRIIKESE